MREDNLNEIVWESVKGLLASAAEAKKRILKKQEKAARGNAGMATELDQKFVDVLIEKVLVYDLEHVEIRWKFSDEVMKMLQG